jgi:thiamine transport system substrate-binding protein
MKRVFLQLSAVAALIALYFLAWKQQARTIDLTVYAYPSFVSSWGAGSRLIEQFEKEFHCQVELVEAGHSGLLLQRLMFEKNRPVADVVMGFDQFSLSQARTLAWRSMKALMDSTAWSQSFLRSPGNDEFVPFDWAPLTFVYRKGEITPPSSLKDLLKPEYARSLSLEDPRNSALGFQFVGWAMALYGAEAGGAFLEGLKPQVFAWSPSWSTAYGFFKKGSVAMAFSYLTSPVYHWIEEKNENFQSIVFDHPHPYQVEYAGVLESCKNCDLAEKFVGFLLRPQSQKLLAEANYMLPTVKDVPLDPAFDRLPTVDKFLDSTQAHWLEENKQRILGTWKLVHEH